MANRLADPEQQLPEYLVGYINNPRETFSCELEPWINPEVNDYDQVKIAKACLALRNKGGGALLIGISDDGNMLALPDDYDPETLFTQDNIQAIVSRYSAQLFGVEVHHVQLVDPPDSRIVAIDIPGNITTPTMCKNDSRTDRDPKISKGIIYTRTVGANGTVSSAPATQQDLEEITKNCFDNRVADIGQFLREHLTEENFSALQNNIENVRGIDANQEAHQVLEEFSASSAESFHTHINQDGED